jgi:hypothetical protein
LRVIERLNEIVPGLIQKYVDEQEGEINKEIANLDDAGKAKIESDYQIFNVVCGCKLHKIIKF